MADSGRCRDRPPAPLPMVPTGRPGQPASRPRDRRMLLSRSPVARHQLSALPSGCRPAGKSHRRGRRRRHGPARPDRHRRRVVRSSREIRRHVPGHAVQPRGASPGMSGHQSGRVSCSASANLGSRAPAGKRLELFARSRPLARGLRVQCRRRPRVESGLAPAPPPGPGPTARRLGGDLPRGRGAPLSRPVGSPGRLHRPPAGWEPGGAPSLLRSPASPPPGFRGARPGPAAAGHAAPRDADVHELRVVLFRHLRHRDRPEPPLCRPGHRSGRPLRTTGPRGRPLGGSGSARGAMWTFTRAAANSGSGRCAARASARRTRWLDCSWKDCSGIG